MINDKEVAKAFIRKPIKFFDICEIYPPSVDNVLDDDFNTYHSYFSISQEDIEDFYFDPDQKIQIGVEDIPTPFEYICNMASDEQHPELAEQLSEAFEMFTHKKLNYLPKQKVFIVGDLEEVLKSIKTINDLPMLNEDNYFVFQNQLRAALGEEQKEPYQYNIHPKIRRMKAKARLRDRVKAKKNGENSLTNNLVSICCMGLGINPLNIGQLSYASVGMLIEKYQRKEAYETDIRSLQAGADPKKVKPVYWMTEKDNNKK